MQLLDYNTTQSSHQRPEERQGKTSFYLKHVKSRLLPSAVPLSPSVQCPSVRKWAVTRHFDFLFLFWDWFFDSVLPFTPHNPESLHNILFCLFEKHWVVWGYGTMCRSHYAQEPNFNILRMLNLRLKAKRKAEKYSRFMWCAKKCDMEKFCFSGVVTVRWSFRMMWKKRFM